jgi:Na+-driven multidrug efflux pump
MFFYRFFRKPTKFNMAAIVFARILAGYFWRRDRCVDISKTYNTGYMLIFIFLILFFLVCSAIKAWFHLITTKPQTIDNTR